MHLKDVDLEYYIANQVFRLNHPEVDNGNFLKRLKKRIDEWFQKHWALGLSNKRDLIILEGVTRTLKPGRAVDSGIVKTNTMRELPSWLEVLAHFVLKLSGLLQRPQIGANGVIDAALAPKVMIHHNKLPLQCIVCSFLLVGLFWVWLKSITFVTKFPVL